MTRALPAAASCKFDDPCTCCQDPGTKANPVVLDPAQGVPVHASHPRRRPRRLISLARPGRG